MSRIITYCLLLIGFIGLNVVVHGQNNVGINTKTPDLTAITHIDDSARGLLLPRTDTQSIWNYVNNLSPNPGITHGLTIFETNMKTIYIYNGIKQKWEPISSNRGPQGAIGPTGDRGHLGPMGISTQWRDTAILDPEKRKPRVTNMPPYFVQLGDTCGDFFHQTSTGLFWTYDCDSNKWVGPIARWRNFGVPELFDIRTNGIIDVEMSTGAPGDTLSQLGNLTYTIQVPPDTVAYVWITSEGTMQKSVRNDVSFNEMAFDFFVIDTNGVGSYNSSMKKVTVGPNFLTASNFTQFDKVPWRISMATTFEGKISPPRNPLPLNDYNTFIIETHVGQFFRSDNPTGPTGAVRLSDAGASPFNGFENYGLMNIYIVFERSKNAPYPY